MKVLLTGASGFLGWHTHVRLVAQAEHEVSVVTRENWQDLGSLLSDVDAVIHVAGVNRAPDPSQVEAANVVLADDVARAVARAARPIRLVYANSVQVGNGSRYALGKARAGEVLDTSARSVGGRYVDVLLPNLFGEQGRPQYNSFVATFVECVVNAEVPTIQDRTVHLLHAQDAAQTLIDGLTTEQPQLRPPGEGTTVQAVYDTLADFHQTYARGDIPPLLTGLQISLFNTLRARLFPNHYPIALQTHDDARGRLVETVRAHGGQGQTFVSTTRPGVTRGDHFHLTKVERFVVLSGRARISLRRVLTDEVISFDVTGESPSIVDMPTMWVHNITNTGNDDVVTMFWTHSLFDPTAPDTYWQPVDPIPEGN